MKRYSNAFALANDFFSDTFKITDLSLLPIENMFTLLSVFFYHKNGRAGAYQSAELKKWFWHTAIGERYSGANFNRNIPKDITFMVKLAEGKKVRYIVEQKIDPLDFLKRDYSRRKSAAVRGYYLMLKHKNPRYLDNGEKMLMEEFAAISNRRDRHHIFSQKLFRNSTSKWKHSLANICLLASDNNQSIGGNYPAVYLKPYRAKKFFKSVMKSHLIPTCNGLWQKSIKAGFKEFINARAPIIIAEIERLAGAKIFEKYEKVRRV